MYSPPNDSIEFEIRRATGELSSVSTSSEEYILNHLVPAIGRRLMKRTDAERQHIVARIQENLNGYSSDDLVNKIGEKLNPTRADATRPPKTPPISLTREFALAVARIESGDIPSQLGMVGDSPALHKLCDEIDHIAPCDVSVLILGETGTGKELVARALHKQSRRTAAPLETQNCGALPLDLLESTLFGHRKGSFTNATEHRAGSFVVADGGTLFLDEIGDFPHQGQPTLLRAIEYGEIRAVGADRPQYVDVRVLAATHRDLELMVHNETFRKDLYYRLNVVTIRIPPLRERAEDVCYLAAHFTAQMGRKLKKSFRIERDGLAYLRQKAWPGNVRQLDHLIQNAAIHTPAGGALSAGTLSNCFEQQAPSTREPQQ